MKSIVDMEEELKALRNDLNTNSEAMDLKEILNVKRKISVLVKKIKKAK